MLLVAFLLVRSPNCHLSLVLAAVVQGDAVNCNSDMSNVTPRYLGSEQKGRVSLLMLTFSSRLASLLLRWKTAGTVLVVVSFSFQDSAPSTSCQSQSACVIARSSAYAYFLEMVVDRPKM